MASEIKVDTIVNAGGDNDTGIDLATNDQILLKVANATKLTMNSTGQTTIVGEGGSTTTNLQQGLAKCWNNLNGTGTIATRDSFNVSGITDVSTGQYTSTFTSNMNSVNYSGQISTEENGLTPSVGRDNDGTGIATGSCDVETHIYNGSGYDTSHVFLSIHGDLA